MDRRYLKSQKETGVVWSMKQSTTGTFSTRQVTFKVFELRLLGTAELFDLVGDVSTFGNSF